MPTPAAVRKLKEIVGPENFSDSQESLLAYSYDATAIEPRLPLAVVSPSTAEQVSRIILLANEERFPVVPRGSGTGLSVGALPVEGSIVLLSNHWNRILEIDRGNMTLTVQAG